MDMILPFFPWLDLLVRTVYNSPFERAVSSRARKEPVFFG